MTTPNKLLDACREALLYLEAPADSPRLWPVARANLTAKLREAITEAERRGER